MRAPTPFALSILSAFTAGAAMAGSVSLDGLVTESPFVLKRAEGPAAPVATENATVEFRGMIATKDGVLFGFYDRTKNTSAWVKEHDKDSEFNVRSYDASSDTVSLDYQGQKLALALSTAKIATAAPVAAIVHNAGQQQQGGGGNRQNRNGGGENANKRPVDPQALESVAEKVRNMRAQRQAAAANGGGGAGAGGGANASTQTGDGSTAAPARQGRSNRNR